MEGGYLDRVPSEADRRVVYAQLTDAAIQFIRDHQPVVEAVTGHRLASLLDESELEMVHDLMHRLSCDNPGWEPPAAVADNEIHGSKVTAAD